MINGKLVMVEYRKNFINLDELKKLINYNPETGKFIWLVNNRRAKIGNLAGSYNAGGYLVIKLYSKHYQASNIAWFYMTGEWPENEIDHKNNITDDNRFINLRKATHNQNCKNRKLNINNTTGFKGVSKRNKRFRSKICVNGVQINLGTFDTLDEAHSAYVKAANLHHKDFANDGKGEFHGGV
jgi:HNH endonuclease